MEIVPTPIFQGIEHDVVLFDIKMCGGVVAVKANTGNISQSSGGGKN